VTTWWLGSVEYWFKSRNYSIPTAEALYLGYNAQIAMNYDQIRIWMEVVVVRLQASIILTYA